MRIILVAALVAAALAGCSTPSNEFNDCTGIASAGPDGAVASGGCGDCQGQAVAGAGDAQAAGGCGDCSGSAAAGGGAASSEGSCAECSGSAAAASGGASSTASCAECSASASADGSAVKTSMSCGSGATKEISVYQFMGEVTGTSPPNPSGDGPAAGELPIAKQEPFVVANGTLALAFESNLGPGAGSARIEVYGPDDTLVYRSETVNCAGAPGAGGACNFQGPETNTDTYAAGSYRIDYFVGGTFDVSLDVTATVPA